MNAIAKSAMFQFDMDSAAGKAKMLALAIVVLAVSPIFIYPVFLMKVLCFALFACAFNLLIGFGGLLSFGHAAFFGSAAYICGHAAKEWGFPPELAILFAAGCSAALGYLFGVLAIRRQGIYFAMVTLALAQMVFFIALQAPFTGGENGLQAIPRGKLLGFINLEDTMTMYVFVCAVFLAGVGIINRTIDSPFGQVLRAIRDNEARALSLGYKVERYKLQAFVLSAALSGVAGATKAIVFQLASLTDVHWSMSGEVILMTLIGGLGTTLGPVIGALVVIGMQNYLAGFGSLVMIVQGLTFMACVLMFREGIVGTFKKLLSTSDQAGHG